MSRQGANQNTPPMFLSHAQYAQLERSFTDPIRRQVTALEAKITELTESVTFWQGAYDRISAEADGLRTEISTLQATVTGLNTQLQTANQTITQQSRTITALQTRIEELEAQGSYPSRYAIISGDRTFTTSTILWFSFNGGYGGDYIASYTKEGTPNYGYVQIPAQSESALILFNSRAHGFSLFVDGQYVEDITDVVTLTAEYNATSNDRILALY